MQRSKSEKKRGRLRRRGVLFMGIGAALVCGGLALFLYNQTISNRAESYSSRVEARLQEEMEADDSGYNIAETEHGDEMDVITIGDYEYIGTIDIPRFGLELPVMSEWSYPGLKISPGRYYGSVWTNDLVIAGHNYTRHFGRLKNLVYGDQVIFTDVNGNVFYYQVVENTVLQPTAIQEMISGNWDLTLFTCTYGGRTRVTVRCEQIDEPDEIQAQEE